MEELDNKNFLNRLFAGENKLPIFNKVNIIFGHNGSGKTSFSRYMKQTNSKAFVYNSDYQDMEVLFKDNKGKPIALMGAKAIENNNTKDELGKKLENLKTDKTTKEVEKTTFKTDLEKTKQYDYQNKNNRDNISGIFKGLSLVGTQYKKETDKLFETYKKNIDNLTIKNKDTIENYKTDIVNLIEKIEFTYDKLDLKFDKNVFMNLSDSLGISDNRATSPNQGGNEAYITNETYKSLSEKIIQIKEILRTPVINNLVDIKKQVPYLDNPHHEKWLKEGFKQFHTNNDICPYCSTKNENIKELFLQLEEYFGNESYKKEVERISGAFNNLKNVLNQGTKVIDENISKACPINIEKEFKDKIEAGLKSLKENKSLYEKEFDKIEKIVNKKIEFPTNTDDFDFSLLENYINTINSICDSLNNVIELSNDNFEKADKINKDKKQDIINYYFAEKFNKDFFTALENETLHNNGIDKSIETKTAEYDKTIGKIEEEISRVNQELETIKKSLSNETLGLETINNYLELLFNNKPIKLEKTTDDNDKVISYVIKRGSSNIRHKSLSEGEKTAIAFAYYLTELKAKIENNEVDTIFIDDPISSLDASMLFFVSNFIVIDIVNKHKETHKIFISTHSYLFYDYICGGYGKLNNLNTTAETSMNKYIVKPVYDNNEGLDRVEIKEDNNKQTFMLFLWKEIQDNNKDDVNEYKQRQVLNLLRQFLEHFCAMFYLDKDRWKGFLKGLIAIRENKDGIKKEEIDLIIKLINDGSHASSSTIGLNDNEYNLIRKFIDVIKTNPTMNTFLK